MLFKNTVGSGFVTGLILHTAQILFAMTGLGLILALAWGVSQAIYIIPALIWATNSKMYEFRKGLLILAGISFLLNALCVGVILVGLSTASFH